MKFYVTQDNAKNLLNQIKQVFQITSDVCQITNGYSNKKYDHIETTKLDCLLLVAKYLQRYPFLGKRVFLLFVWEELLQYRLNTYLVTEKSIAEFNQLLLSIKK